MIAASANQNAEDDNLDMPDEIDGEEENIQRLLTHKCPQKLARSH